jgi:uncharacterized protein (UPF0548 family)
MGLRSDESGLESRPLSYDCAGATCPADDVWIQHPSGFRRYERSVPVGHGAAEWSAVSDALMTWGVKTRSGFRVAPPTAAREGESYSLIASVGPFAVREPIRVVAVTDGRDRCGFAYGTLEGHPVSGEEAFVVHRSGDTVMLTLRSLTRPAPGRWRYAFPALLCAQRFYRRRYLRALG